MSTRSNTIIKTGNQKIMCMYRHSDGYPTGHGQDLVDFLEGMEIVNGISVPHGEQKAANGMSCLAAQIVAEFKVDIGGIYLVPPVGPLTSEHDYCYTLSAPNPSTLCPYAGPADELLLTVHRWGKVIFKGTVAEFRQALKDEKFG